MQGTNIFRSTNNECSYVCVRARVCVTFTCSKGQKNKDNRFEVK